MRKCEVNSDYYYNNHKKLFLLKNELVLFALFTNERLVNTIISLENGTTSKSASYYYIIHDQLQ